MGQTSIPCTKAARDELAETKPENMSWSEYLLTLRDGSDQLEQSGGSLDDVLATTGVCQFGDVDVPEGGFEDIDEALDAIQASLGTVEERTGRIERMLDEVTGP